MNTKKQTPTEQLLQITPGTFCLGAYRATTSFIERVQEEPQAAVMVHRPGMLEGEQGMLIAVCGDASDPASSREAVLFAASPLLFDVCVMLVEYAKNTCRPHLLEKLPGLLDIVELAKAASLKAIIDTQTPEEVLTRFKAEGV